MPNGPFDGLETYAHPMSVMDALASALMCLDDGLWEYTPNPETEKMIRRGLKGWAEKHDRPNYYPWNQHLFSQFWEA